MNEILYCHAEEDTDTVGAGDWFFHTGQWAQCAAAGETEDGGWNLCVAFEVAGKPLARANQHFDSFDACKAFLESYFEVPVVEVDPSDFPAPDDL